VRFPLGSPSYGQQAQRGEVFLYGLKILGAADDPPRISEVEPGSDAEKQGLKAGQHLRSVNGHAVWTVDDAQSWLLVAHRRRPEVAVQTSERRDVVRLAVPSPLPRGRPIHPTQLYSSVDAVVLCLFLLAYAPFARRDGELLALLLTLYPINRFLMEFIRIDEPGVLWTRLSIGQIVSLLLLSAAAALWVYVLRRPPGRAHPARAG